MPKALSSETSTAATKAPSDAAEAADHDDDEGLDDDVQVHRVVRRLARQSAARRPSAARKTPSANTLVNSHF